MKKGKYGEQSKEKYRNMSNKMLIWVIKRERMCQRLGMYTNMQEQLIFFFLMSDEDAASSLVWEI